MKLRSPAVIAETTQCSICTHCRLTAFKCDAFPGGIPEDILTGEYDHIEPYPGDHGIMFEPIVEGGK